MVIIHFALSQNQNMIIFNRTKEMFLVDTDGSAELRAQYSEFVYYLWRVMLEMFIFRLFKVCFLRNF